MTKPTSSMVIDVSATLVASTTCHIGPGHAIPGACATFGWVIVIGRGCVRHICPCSARAAVGRRAPCAHLEHARGRPQKDPPLLVGR
eukprot:4799186-Prymnesium_polylepis.1